MKRFWLFGGEDYYPSGGLLDFIRSFETVTAATDYLAETMFTGYSGGSGPFEWWHIFDSQAKEILVKSGSDCPDERNVEFAALAAEAHTLESSST